MRPLLGIGGAEVVAQRVAGELGDLAGHLDAGGAGADHHEGQPLVAPLGIALDLCGLEGREDAAAHVQGALERLHLGGIRRSTRRGRSRSSASRPPRSACRTHRIECRHVVDRFEEDPALLEVEAGDLGEQDAHVVVALEDRPERIRDLAGRQRPGRDLVGERLEEVEVAAVDQGDLDRRPPQRKRSLKAPEAAADDDDPVDVGLRFRHCPASAWPRD